MGISTVRVFLSILGLDITNSQHEHLTLSLPWMGTFCRLATQESRCFFQRCPVFGQICDCYQLCRDVAGFRQVVAVESIASRVPGLYPCGHSFGLLRSFLRKIHMSIA